MDGFAVLDLARREVADRIALVRADQWTNPTPCEGWTVRHLADHLVRGCQMAVRLLDGLTRDAAIAAIGEVELGDDAWRTFATAAAAQAAAFAAPGALERTCEHAVGPIPGSLLLDFRTADLTLHAWDLARGIGANENLDPQLVEAVWDAISPHANVIAQSGMFGSGPSGRLAEDAPLQHRMLDLSGRRP